MKTKKVNSTLFLAVITLIAIIVLKGLGNALFPLVAAIIWAYLLFPTVERLEKVGFPRIGAVFGTFLIMTLIVAIFVFVIAPALFREFRDFFTMLPETATTLLTKVESFLNNNGGHIDLSKEGIKETLIANANLLSGKVLGDASSVLQKIFTNAFSGLLWILNLVLFPLFFFNFVMNYENIISSFKSFVPVGWRPTVNKYLRLSDIYLKSYIRGQMFVCTFLGVGYATGFALSGVRFGIFIGFATGALCIMPYLGNFIGISLAVLLSLANLADWHTYLGIAITFAVVQGIEGFYVTPRLVGKSVGLSMIGTILVLIIGGNLFGILGMIIAIPFAAITKHIAKDYFQTH